MKEGKAFFKSRMKWVGLVGLVLSAFSLFVHFLLARFTEYGFSEYQSSITIFSWRPLFETSDLSRTVMCKVLCFQNLIFLDVFLAFKFWFFSFDMFYFLGIGCFSQKFFPLVVLVFCFWTGGFGFGVVWEFCLDPFWLLKLPWLV